MKRIVLCADDYGQTSAISQGIINLIEQERLSATSCIVNTAHWLPASKALLSYRAKIDIGLHLNFTEGEPLSQEYHSQYGRRFFSLNELLIRAFSNRLSLSAFKAEAQAQMACFIANMEGVPDFLDGHQHVHQFPGLRKVVVELYHQYFPQATAYVRLVNPIINTLKKAIIRSSGIFFKHTLLKCHIPHNLSFSGIYPFDSKMDYRQVFKNSLNEVGENGLLMCHPGLKAEWNDGDTIAHARYREYQYFSSELFKHDCLNQKVSLSRFDV